MTPSVKKTQKRRLRKPATQLRSAIQRFYPPTAGKRGQPPGVPGVPAKTTDAPVCISLFHYGADDVREISDAPIQDVIKTIDSGHVAWINFDGLHDPDVLATAADHFRIHPLTMEDIVHTGQRPKCEEVGDYLYIVLNMLRYEEERRMVTAEQVSLVVGNHMVLSFQEREGDVFGVIRDRLRLNKGRIRKQGADYLAYCLMDAVVDQYFLILERLGERLAELEELVIDHPTPEILQDLYRLKHELIFLRKSVWPLRESVGTLYRSDSEFIQSSTGVYLRDLYDHTMHVIDTVETFRDMCSGLLDIYLSSVSNRMNEVMKVLTVIATIFIPLTFVAGVYGMNFDFMPELHWRWGYFGTLGVMLLMSFGMLAFFRRKGWL